MDGFPILIITTLLRKHTIYIDDKWNLQSHLLDTAEMSMDHTALNVARELQDSLTDKTENIIVGLI